MTAPLRYDVGTCPHCHNRIILNTDGTLRVHAKNPNMGAGSRKCAGGGKRPIEATLRKAV